MSTEYKTIRVWKTIVERVDALVQQLAADVGSEGKGVKVSRSHVLERALDAIEEDVGAKK